MRGREGNGCATRKIRAIPRSAAGGTRDVPVREGGVPRALGTKKRGPRAGPSLETDRTATEWLSGFRRGRDSRVVLEELLVQLDEVLPLIGRLVLGEDALHR